MKVNLGLKFKTIQKIIWFGAVLFLIATLIDTLFWPNQYNFIVDNYLFPFGLLFLGQYIYENRPYRLIIVGLIALFLWECIVSFWVYDQISFDVLSYLLRVLKLPVIFAITSALVIELHLKLSQLQVVKTIFYLLATVNIIMLINPFGLGADLHYLYSPKLSSIFGNYNEPGVFRLSGTFMNPNDNAQIFGVFFIYFLARGVGANWIEVALSLSFLFLTQSRTAYLAIIAVFIFSMFIAFSVNKSKNLKPLLIIILAALLLMLVMQPINLVSIFNGTAFQSYSFSTRIQILMEFLGSDIKVKLIGVGSVIESISRYGWYFDSEYLYILFQYGLVGLLSWISVLVLILRYKWRSTVVISMVIYVVIVSLTNQTFHNPSTSAFILFFLALFVNAPDTKFQMPAINNPVTK